MGGAWAGWVVRDREELIRLGGILDERPPILGGRSTLEFLAERLLQVRGKDGRLHRLKPNAMQRAYEQKRGAGNIVLKARQMGMTTWVAGRFLLKTMCRPGTLTLQVAHTQEAAEELLGIVHRFLDLMPEGMRRGVLRQSKRNVRQIVFPEMDSEYRVVSAWDRNAGRGMTYQNLHCSEVGRWGWEGEQVLAGLRAGLAPGGEQVLESTPNGVGGCFYDEWQRAGAAGLEGTSLVKHFFPWWMEAGYRAAAVEAASLTEEERGLMEREGLDLEQIGYRRTLGTGLQGFARQEFVEEAETCFKLSGDPYFEMDVVEKQLLLARSGRLWEENGRVEIWADPLPGKAFVVAVDPAGGGSDGDLSAIEVIDVASGMQVAEFAGHVGGLELARLVAHLGWYFNHAVVVVERNNHGHSVLAMLEQTVGYKRIYRTTDGPAGLLTTSVSRPAMLGQLAAAIAEAPGLFQSRRFLTECRSFVRLPNGSMGARAGAHDDRVMAMAMGWMARAEMSGKGRD